MTATPPTLSPGELDCLRCIADDAALGGHPTLALCMEGLGVSRQYAQRLIASLIAQGCLAAAPRRMYRPRTLSLTPLGRFLARPVEVAA